MGTYSRLGSYLLASELTSDPFGAIHRAVLISGNGFDRHVLVRTFSEELFQAGLDTRLAEAGRVVPLLGGARIFGLGYQIEDGKTPHLAWDHVAGRSLAQLIDRARQEQVPFGVDHALTVIQGVAQGLVQLHAKGLSHGVLSPHSVWVSLEGSTQILDAPYAPLVKSLLPKAPVLRQRLAPYLQAEETTPLQRDFFALGAVLYELLTFEPLPVGADLQTVLEQATLKAAQEDAPLPAELRAFLGRLLLGRQPFATVEAFCAELERVLYDGDYSPTTFNMAFFMHTLFREENDRDALAMKAEQGDNYLAYTAAGESLRSGAARVLPSEGQPESPAGSKHTPLLIGGGLAAVVILGLGFMFLFRPRTDPAVQKQLAELSELSLLKKQLEQQKADLDARAKAESEKTVQLQKQLGETRSVEDRARIQKQLEEARQRSQEVERQQKVAAQRLDEQRAAEAKTTALPPASVPAPPGPTPEAAPPQQEAAKTQASPAPPPPAPAPAAPTVSEPARLMSQVAPVFPPRALQTRWELNQDHLVRLKVYVNEQGQPMKVTVIEGVPGTYGFDEAAVEAANKSTFSPATRDGKPVRGWTPDILYRFQKRR